ncbi:MAG TPA: polysaccharide deacetylase family protein [Candidatus Eisenbacteria bacterium]|nr:polysaccharide deacetylase family protein [Candidatus Eisenbacteria bacterium]
MRTGNIGRVLRLAALMTAVMGAAGAIVGPVPAAGTPAPPRPVETASVRPGPAAGRRTAALRMHPPRPLPDVRLATGPDGVPPDAPVTLAFSVPVDTVATQRSFQIVPAVAGVIHWPDPLTLTFQPLSPLAYETTYAVSVSAPPAGGSGPEGGGQFTFTTGRPQPALPYPFTLTFDDCGTAQGIHAILDALSDRGLHAIFFPTGMCRDQFPWLIPTLIAAGHRVCNHTYSHPVLPRLSNAAIATEIRRGVSVDCDLLRPPYGAVDPGGRVASVAASLGYRLQLWDVDTRDWAGTPANVMDGMIRARGGVVLFHMQGVHTVEAIRAL